MPRKDELRIRRGTSAEWSAANPVLLDGEPGYDTTLKQWKVGDGTTAWNSLAFDTGGGGGSTAFSALTGVPTDNTALDTALKLRRETLVTRRALTASHTLDATDLTSINAGKELLIEIDSASANNLTIPLNATVAFPIGTVITGMQYGAGLTSVVATGGVTIHNTAGGLSGPGQNKPFTLIKRATNEWWLFNGAPSGASGAFADLTGDADDNASLVSYVASQVTAAVTGLYDDRGNHNASSNLFPSTGGSGTAGAILKGDIWTISVAGTLGGTAVVPGQTVRALVDTPGTTSTNWSISVGSSDIPDASTTVKGKVELATNAETVTGTDTVRATTPAGVKAAIDNVSYANNTGNLLYLYNNFI